MRIFHGKDRRAERDFNVLYLYVGRDDSFQCFYVSRIFWLRTCGIFCKCELLTHIARKIFVTWDVLLAYRVFEETVSKFFYDSILALTKYARHVFYVSEAKLAERGRKCIARRGYV